MTTGADKLAAARRHLAQVEAEPLAADADYHLEEGLYLLEELVLDGDQAAVATNVGTTYFGRIFTLIERALEPDDVPEPTLKHLLRLSQRLGATPFAGRTDVTALTARVATRYIDAVFEGYSEAEKRRQIDKLWARIRAEQKR